MRAKFAVMGTLIIVIGLMVLTLSVAREKTRTQALSTKLKKERLNRSMSKKLQYGQAQPAKRQVAVSKDLKVKAHFKN